MKRPEKSTTEDRIFAAVIDIGATQGIGATSMAAVAKAARVSAGTLYLHFPSKDDMLQAVYLRLKHAFHSQLMAATGQASPGDDLAGMWHALLAFQASMPNAILFLETAGAAQILTDDQKRHVAGYQQEVNAVIAKAIKAGAITVGLEVAITVLVGSALHLARRHALLAQAVPEAEAAQTFAAVWHGLGGT